MGKLPSQLDLTPAQRRELLAYHRIKRKMQNICPNCIKDDRAREKVCFICGATYTEDRGTIAAGTGPRPDAVEVGEEQLAAFLVSAQNDQEKTKKQGMSEEDKAAWELYKKRCIEAGLLVDDSKSKNKG